MKKIFVNLICVFIPFSNLRHKVRNNLLSYKRYLYWSLIPYHNTGKNNKIVIIKNGKRKTLSKFCKIKGLNVYFKNNDNLLEIELPCNFEQSNIRFEALTRNSKVFIGKNVSGSLSLTLHGKNNIVSVGEDTSICKANIVLISNELRIGKDCMISAEVIIFGDGHSVLDYATKKVINLPKAPILIGDHCWLGMQTTFLKGAQIPNDCIVGFKSLVTKPFTTEHCVIAGNPAKIVKEGISWDRFAPLDYKEFIEDKK